jgi:chromosome segregation ATPase
MNTTTNPDSWKAIFNRPGGTFAKITAVGAALGIGFGIFKALPFLVAGMTNLITLVLEVIVLVAILTIVTSKSFWRWIGLFWYQLNKFILGLFVKMDPISILEASIAKLKDKMEIINENVKQFGGVHEQMKKSLQGYQSEYETVAARIKVTKKALDSGKLEGDRLDAMKASLVLDSQKLTTLVRMIDNQNKRLDVSDKYLKVLKKLRQKGDLSVKKAEIDLGAQKEEYKQAKASRTALRNIMSIFKGGDEDLATEMALESINDEINTATAEMNEFLDGSNPVLANLDVSNMADVEKALSLVEGFEKKGWDLSSDQQRQIADNKRLNQWNRAAIDTEYSMVGTNDKSDSENRYFD